MDDTLKNPDDIEKYLNLSVLGSIPVLDEELVKSRSGKKKKKVSDHSHVVMTETLSDASKLVREAKAVTADPAVKDFIEPKEPRGIEVRKRR